MDPITLTNVESGFLGIAIGRGARTRRLTRRLYKENRQLDRVLDDIERIEEKLERLGVDPDDLYEGWGFEDVDFAREGRNRVSRPGGVLGRGGRQLPSYEDDEQDSLTDGGDDDGNLSTSGLVFVGRLF